MSKYQAMTYLLRLVVIDFIVTFVEIIFLSTISTSLCSLYPLHLKLNKIFTEYTKKSG